MEGAQNVERQEVEALENADFGAMDDAALEAALNGADESGNADNIINADGTGDAAQKDSGAAQDGGEGGKKAEQDVPAPTVESLSKQLEDLKKTNEQIIRERQHWQQTASKQGGELGELRKIKEAIAKRIADRQAINPADQMFTDPDGFARRGAEELADQQAMAQVEAREKDVQRQNWVSSNRAEVHRQIADIGIKPEEFETPENLNAIAEAMIAAGEQPENVERWKSAPYMFSNSVTMYYWQRAQYANLRKEFEELKAKAEQQPRDLMKKVEDAARKKPLPNASGGTAGKFADINPKQIESLSDAELDALLQEVK